MPPTKQIPFAVIEAQELARWLDAQPETWWTVDGDPLLTAELDLPCPAQELSAVLRKHAGNLFVFAPDAARHGEVITGDQFDSFSTRDARHNERSFLLRWEEEDQQWLLSEDTASSKQQE